MRAIVAGQDRYLRENIVQLVKDAGIQVVVRTTDIARLLHEAKQPGRTLIIDMTWEAVQEHGTLRQVVNIGHISGNKLLCICPNRDEDLKKLAGHSRADEIFIRYDLTTRFKDYMREIQLGDGN